MAIKNKMPKHDPDFLEPLFPHESELSKEIENNPGETHHHVDQETGEIFYQVEFRRLKNTANAVPHAGKIITDPSKTIPDQSMTIHEILRRNQAGLSTGNITKIPMYDGAESPDDLILPDLSKIDLADRQAILDEYEDMLRDVTDRLKKQGKYAPKEQPLGPPKVEPPKEEKQDPPKVDPKTTNNP